MASTENDQILELIESLIHTRVKLIKSGDRNGLDETYATSSIKCRNNFNQRDYDLYMQIIESGFGAELQKYEINEVDEKTIMPFVGITYFVTLPSYVIRLTSVDQRVTEWFVKLEREIPKIDIPVFDGKAFYRLLSNANPISITSGQSVTGHAFDEFAFAEELSKRIYLELWSVRQHLQHDKVRAIAVDCLPWHGQLILSILTDKEDFSEHEYGKWCTAEWRFFDFTSVPNEPWPYARDLAAQIAGFYDEDAADIHERNEIMFRACARALTSESVQKWIKRSKFTLADDFELGVFNPDNIPSCDGDADTLNYCKQLEHR